MFRLHGWAMVDGDRDPVIVGVGDVCERPAGNTPGRDTITLIADAIRTAAHDAGIVDLRPDRLAVVDALARSDRSYPIALAVQDALGIAARVANSSPSPSGNYPVRFLDDAANAIAEGSATLAVVAGGEAMRSFARRGGAAAGNGTQVIRGYRGGADADIVQRHGLVTPIDVYPLYEQATRHAWGQTLAEAQAESGAIWAGNAAVAARNPYAWIRDARDADEIVSPSAANSMLSFPYTRMMVANSSVNQAAALIVTSVAHARALGIDPARVVHVGYGAAADEAPGNLDRADFFRSPAMEASLLGVLEANELTVADLDHVELYSCFPCVPKMARRVIGWPLDRPHSIYGGLTFGGGPIGNCMTHALTALVRRIRAGSRNGLIFANGGFATRNHSIALTRQAPPGGRRPRDYSIQGRADAARGSIPRLIDGHRGDARIESFVVPYASGIPQHATIVARTPAGDRLLARVLATDTVMIDRLIAHDADAIGMIGAVSPGTDGLLHWRPA